MSFSLDRDILGLKSYLLYFFQVRKKYIPMWVNSPDLKLQARHIPKVKMWTQVGLGDSTHSEKREGDPFETQEAFPQQVHTQKVCVHLQGTRALLNPSVTFLPALERCRMAEWLHVKQITPNSKTWVQVPELPLTSREIRAPRPFRKEKSLLSILCVTQPWGWKQSFKDG